MPLTPVCWQKPKPRGLQTLDFHSSESINVVVCISRLAAVFGLFNYKEFPHGEITFLYGLARKTLGSGLRF